MLDEKVGTLTNACEYNLCLSFYLIKLVETLFIT